MTFFFAHFFWVAWYNFRSKPGSNWSVIWVGEWGKAVCCLDDHTNRNTASSYDDSWNICWAFTRPEGGGLLTVKDVGAEALSALCDLPKVIHTILGNAKDRIHGFGIAFCASPIPLLWKMSNWENRKWALIQLKHMLPFMLWSRILVTGKMCPFNQYRPNSDEAVIVTFIKSGHCLAQSGVLFCTFLL